MNNPNGYIDIDPANTDHLFNALSRQEWPEQWHPTDSYLTTPPQNDDEAFKQVLDEGLSFRSPRENYRLGNPDLPVAPYREHITDTIFDNTYTVLSSPTGTGKSSQTGLYLLEGQPAESDRRIFISQPRIPAARQLMQWAREGLQKQYAEIAGYLTGTARDSDANEQTRIIYITEQKLFKMANRGQLGPNDIVINDEAHERSIPTIFLQGIMKELIMDNPGMKLVIASATIDVDRFAEGFLDPITDSPAKIVELKGTTHPITDIHTEKHLHIVARECMQTGNVLAFEPGEQRQIATATAMSDRRNGHTVHVLNASMPPSEQEAALTAEDKNHVVGNKIAETSLTPAGKDFVIDSGLSNVAKYQQGKRVLKTVHSSKDIMMQRRGRIGRTKPGTYIVAQPNNAPPIAYEDRDEYEMSPIENGSVAPFITELLASGRRIENMGLLERPTEENLAYDYKLLKRLGAIVTQDGELKITPIGKAMNDLPLDPTYARMLVEARSIDRYYEVDTTRVRTQVAAAAAIRQVNGMLNTRAHSRSRFRNNRKHEESMSNEHKSDVLFELDVFIKAYEKQRVFMANGGGEDEAKEKFEMYLRSKDILVNRYNKIFDIFEEICLREDLDHASLEKPLDIERLAIVGSQIAGAEELFVQKSKSIHRDVRGESRRLGKRSTIDPNLARLVVGTAFDYVGLHDGGHFPREFIVGASAVSTRQLLTHAPQRITHKSLEYAVTPEGDVVERQALYFDNEILIDEIEVAPQPTIKTREFIIRAMMTGIAQSAGRKGRPMKYPVSTPHAQQAIKQWQKSQDLEHRSRADLRTQERYEKLIAKIVFTSIDKVPLEVTDPHEIDAVIPRVYLHSLVRPSKRKDIPEILRRSPDAISFLNNEENRVYLPVYYRNSIAYLTIPRDLQYQVKAEDIADLLANHNVKIRVGDNGQYMQANAMFDTIEKKRNAPQRQKRLQRRAQNQTKVSTQESYEAAVRRVAASRKLSKKVLAASEAPKTQKKAYLTRKTASRARDRRQAISASIDETSA